MPYTCKHCHKRFDSQNAIAGHMNFCKIRNPNVHGNAIVARSRAKLGTNDILQVWEAAHKAEHDAEADIFNCDYCIGLLERYVKEKGYGFKVAAGVIKMGDSNTILIEDVISKNYTSSIANEMAKKTNSNK
ncbi:MAG: hypothetical protein KGH60_03375 [Candidatus Micrarchaeota archaeon]|nr:hypothetical protein [Candidatus Micrarchaeota archaeon]